MNNKNQSKKKFLPVWVWIIALIEIILVLFFSIGTAMNPGEFIPGVSELNYVTQLYITRNVTAVLGLIIALLLRSHKALFVMLIVRIVTDISDVVTVYAFDAEIIKSSVPMVVGILIIPPLFALGYLWKRIQNDN
ncbi:hypothetical protein UJ101_02003 [Flavobacteriaceae bacterium UJ101]|nr:hypothetical protein UJ101_02003 [Flavobacteriaceae bacterium UJ101]